MIIYILLLLLSLADQYLFGFVLLEEIIIILSFVAVFRFIRTLTKRIGIPEIISVIGCLVYLVMPLVTYRVFNEYNYLARLYETSMVIDEDIYFSFALPGTILLLIGLQISWIRQKKSDINLIEWCKSFLSDRTYLGYLLIGLGIAGSVAINYVPPALMAVLYFQSQLTFIGFLYLLHSRIAGKTVLLIIAFAILLAQSAMTGMFGELIFWSVLGGIILILNKRINFVARAAFILAGAFSVFLIQSVKHEYRQAMWSGSQQGSKPGVMLQLIINRVSDPALMIREDGIFGIVTRANQGFLVARTMDYVPKREPYANGETIVTAFAAAVVPRFLWQDKPEVGGREMVCRFLGDCRTLRYSYDIGQLGEGYVNFGKFGGILFMLFYGMLIRTLFVIAANTSIKHPALVLWIPLFFFSALSLETDFLTFINSFVKSVVFCAIVYLGFRWLLRIRM